jgi:hypothetical protein
MNAIQRGCGRAPLICIKPSAGENAMVRETGVPMANVITLGIVVLLLGLCGYAMFVESQRMLRDGGRLRLRRMLARRGVSLAATNEGIYEAARATRRCLACADKAQCDAWLASHQRQGFEAFCPNTGFIDHAARA